MPSRNRQDNRDHSRHRYGHKNDSREHNPGQQRITVRFESRRSDYRRNNHKPTNFQSRSKENRPQSPNQNRQHDFSSNFGRRSYNSSNRFQNQTPTHCKRTNHPSKECKVCFNCLNVRQFHGECRALRSSILN